MNGRQAYALANPINTPQGTLNPRLRGVRPHPRKFLLMSILAVDR